MANRGNQHTKRKKTQDARSATLPMPESWKTQFLGTTMRTSFALTLTQGMIEFLCAVSDDVTWDRAVGYNIHRPDNWVATETALTKRGLIRRKCKQEVDRQSDEINARYIELKARNLEMSTEEWHARSMCELTPAGAALVELFKVVGMFVQADAVAGKSARKVR